MCLDNINANMLCYKDKEFLSDNDLIKTIQLKKDNNGKYINNFKLKIYFNFISNNNELKKKMNVLDSRGYLMCEIELEKICDGSDNLVLSLADFEIDLTTNKDFYLNVNYNVIYNVPIYLPKKEEEGNYVFNLMLKRKINGQEDDEWTLQSVYGIRVVDENNDTEI